MEVDDSHPEKISEILPANFKLVRVVEDMFDVERFVKLQKV